MAGIAAVVTQKDRDAAGCVPHRFWCPQGTDQLQGLMQECLLARRNLELNGSTRLSNYKKKIY